MESFREDAASRAIRLFPVYGSLGERTVSPESFDQRGADQFCPDGDSDLYSCDSLWIAIHDQCSEAGFFRSGFQLCKRGHLFALSDIQHRRHLHGELHLFTAPSWFPIRCHLSLGRLDGIGYELHQRSRRGASINYVPPQQILLGIIGGSPDGIAVDGAGDAFVSEYFGPNTTDDGEIVEIPKGCTNGSCVLDYIDHSQLVALTNPGGDYAPGAIAMDSAGNLYVTFSYPPNSNFDTGLYEFPRGCTTAACAIPIGSGEHGVVDIAVDGSGNVYAASISGGDVSNYQVWKISPGCDLASCTAAISGIYVEINAVAADRYGNVFFTGAAKDGIPTTAYEIPAGCNDSSCIVSVETPVSTATNVTGVSTDGLGDLFYSDDYDLYEIPVGCNTSSCYLALHTGYQFLSGPILATDGSNNVYVMDYLGVVYELDLNDPPPSPSRPQPRATSVRSRRSRFATAAISPFPSRHPQLTALIPSSRSTSPSVPPAQAPAAS